MNLNNSLADWIKYQENSHPLEIDLGLERVLAIAKKLPSLQPFASKFKFFNADFSADAKNLTQNYVENQTHTQNQASENLNLNSNSNSNSVKIITVAGTNGKGSTALFLQNLLLADGRKTGVYTSPHIKDYRERFLINGDMIQAELLVASFDEIFTAKGDISLSYFEWATLAAFVAFAKSNLDFWIMEVGLGGRLDAVNIANADIGIITSIGRDHEEYLGTSLNAIGSEKAGIFCENQTAIYSSRLMPISIEQKSQELGIKLLRAGIDFSFSETIVDINWNGVDAKGEPLNLNLPKPHIASLNASGALQAYCLLSSNQDSNILRQAVANTLIAGRMQKIGKFILDVAHNPPAMVHLVNKLEKNCKRLAIIGMLKDKDITRSLQILAPSLQEFFMVSLPSARGTSKEAMFAYGIKAGVNKDKISLFANIDAAIQLAKEKLNKQEIDEVLILGSFVTLELALDILQPKQEI